jgi:hypothetical protein
MQIEFLVEEISAKAALDQLLPRLLPEHSCRVRVFEGWQDLLGQLKMVLQGYHRRIFREGQTDLRVVVLLDGDGICERRKTAMEAKAAEVGLLTKTTAGAGQLFHVLNRVSVQELEAWWLGDREAIMAAYPGVKLAHFKGTDRNPDAPLKPSEVLWEVLKKGRYFLTGKRKTQWAMDIAAHLDPTRNASPSFRYFCEGLAAPRYTLPAATPAA